MDQYVRELYCSRIIAGYIRYNEFKIYWPAPDVIYEGCELYRDVYEDARQEGLFTTKELHSLLSISGIWPSEHDTDIKILGENLDKLKIQAYKNIQRAGVLRGIKSSIEETKARINKLVGTKHKYDHITCEGVATFAKWSWMMENSVYRNSQLADCDVSAVLEFWNASRISDDEIREIARTDPWQACWQSKTSSLFDKPSCNLNDEQRRLVVWSKMFDNIRESGEAPSEEVINDDDALDGWMLLQKKKRDKERKSDQVEAGIKSDKIRGAQDIMVKAWTPEEANEIAELNDEDSSMFRRMRIDQIKKGTGVEANKLADMRLRKLKK